MEPSEELKRHPDVGTHLIALGHWQRSHHGLSSRVGDQPRNDTIDEALTVGVGSRNSCPNVNPEGPSVPSDGAKDQILWAQLGDMHRIKAQVVVSQLKDTLNFRSEMTRRPADLD